MLAHVGTAGVTEDAMEPLGVIEDFCKLGPSRKAMLRDHLFTKSRFTFEQSVRFFWPDIDGKEMDKLERFLKILKSVSH